MMAPTNVTTMTPMEHALRELEPTTHYDDARSEKLIISTSGAPNENENMSDRSCRVYVGNVAWKAQWQDLKDHMRSLGGNVIRADVFLDPQGRSKGCGIVEYETREEAQQAIEKLNDSELFDRKIFVREDREDDPEFRGRRGPYSTVRRKRTSGMNHVNYNNRSSGDFRPNRNHKAPTNSRKNPILYESRFSNSENVGSCRLFVGNLPWETNWKDLKTLFQKCGDVIRAEIHTENGVSCGCGTVLFKSPDQAQQAIAQFNNYELDGRPLLVRLNDTGLHTNPGAQ